MFSVAPMPIFDASAWDFHRPAVSSPLSSSPIRGHDASASSPLAPLDGNTLPQLSQSSPIPAPKFKFAARGAWKNPLTRKREDAQEGRRKMFLQNVRQKADDRTWERRDVESTVLKSDWQAELRWLEQSRRAAAEAIATEADIDDQPQPEPAMDGDVQMPTDMDDAMVDEIAMLEQSEMDAMISSFLEGSNTSAAIIVTPPSPSLSLSLSDDEDYDQLFLDLAMSPSQLPSSNQDITFSQEMDMS